MTILDRFPRRRAETPVRIERVPLVGLMAKTEGEGWRSVTGEEVIASEPCSGAGVAGCSCVTCATRRLLGVAAP